MKLFFLLTGLAVSLSGCAGNKEAKTELPLPIAYEDYTGEYPDFTLVFDDRFDQKTAFWEFGDGTFPENACRFTPEGVKYENGTMSLVVTEDHVPGSWSNSNGVLESERDYSSGEIRSKKPILYGRLEARVRNPPSETASGYISSLFTYVNDKKDGFKWREIDIEMEGLRPSQFQANYIFGEGTWQWWETRLWGAYEEKIEIGSEGQWRVFALEWTDSRIRWYVNGVLVKELTNDDLDGNPPTTPEGQAVQKHPAFIPQIAQQIIMNFWIPNDLVQDHFGGNKRNNIYPMKAEYDWFRYYSWTPRE